MALVALCLAAGVSIGCHCTPPTPDATAIADSDASDRGESAIAGTDAPEASAPASSSAADLSPSRGEVPADARLATPRDRSLTITDPRQLGDELDLAELRELDLALSVDDSHERPTTADELPRTTDTCDGLDLEAVARRAPQLEVLRVSGCGPAVHAGLGAFASHLESLELADLDLDELTLARIAQLTHLRRLTLTRVRLVVESAEPLAHTLKLTHLTLRELERDSVLGDLLGDFRGLTHVVLEGEWAGHRAMLSLAKADRLESLTLTDTSIGNFSLNQIRGQTALRSVDWSGTTFNDNSPLYLRDLPVESFRCACAHLGDGGLRHLRYLRQLRKLELPQSQVTSAGLDHLGDLAELEELSFADRELDERTFAALARLPHLRRLVIDGGTLLDPQAQHLGELVGLRHLTLRVDRFDDRGAAQLATLVDLRELDISHTRVTDQGLASLAALSQLEVLELHHTNVTNRGLAHLAGMRALRSLALDHTDVVDSGVAHLATLEQLEDLRLDSTLVTDGAIDHLLGMKRLRRLNLSDTVISADGAAKLHALPSLRAVNLENTRARPAVPG